MIQDVIQPPVRRSRRLGLSIPQSARARQDQEIPEPNELSMSSISERALTMISQSQG